MQLALDRARYTAQFLRDLLDRVALHPPQGHLLQFAIAQQAFLYPLVFTSSSNVKPVTLGVVTDLIRGDVFYWGELMAGALIAGLPVAILFNYFLDDFVEGVTGGAVK